MEFITELNTLPWDSGGNIHWPRPQGLLVLRKADQDQQTPEGETGNKEIINLLK